MIVEVTRYQTKDGVLHEDEKDAELHLLDVLANKIGPIIDGTGIGIKDRLKVVDALVGSPDKANKLKKILEMVL